MAEGFDPYHVPQQRRRDKLRFANFQLQGLLPIYDPSLYSSDFMTVGACTMGGTNNNHCGGGTACTGGGGGEGVKEELGGNFLGYAAGAGGGNFSGGAGGGSNSSTSSVTNHLMYMMDPRSSSSIQLNPSCSIQEMDPNNPFLYNNPQQSSFKFFNHGGEVVVCPPPHPAEEQLSAAGSTRIMNACSHGLSLSLSSQHHNQQSSITTTTTTSTLPLELNLQNYEHDPSIYTKKIASFSGTVNELSRNSVPLGPFTGYASVLKGSRFLGPAQQLLEEICDVGEGNYPQKLSADTVMLDPSMENIAKNVNEDSSQQSCNLGSDQRRKKSRLMLLLNEVYRRYKQYCHQMQAVVASFESVAGVKNAAPFASMAVKAMSKHFNFLRNVISDQLQQFLTEPHNNVVAQEKDIAPAPSTYDHTSSATGMFDFVQHQPVWRPQRGLPERAVTILRAWLFDHFLHPYPTDTDKLMLAKQTGLSRNQVSNWFINARVRLWKPMVEEIHMLETRQAQKSSHEEAVSNVHHDRESNQLIHAASSTTVPVSSLKTPTSSVQRIQDNNNIMSLKRGRNEPTAAEKNALLMDRRNYDQNLSAFPQVGFGVSSGGGANGGVSLTLGLQQNNSGSSTRLTDIPFSVSAARRLGLVDPNGEEYVAGGWR